MKCIACGNNINDGLMECNVCGAKQINNQYTHTMPIHYQNNNQTVYPYQNNQAQYNGIPYNGYQYPMYNQVNPKKKSGMDVASMIFGIIGIYYLFSLLVVISSGLNEFVQKEFDTTEMQEILQDPLTAAICMSWPLFLAPILGFVFGLLGRKKAKNGMNLFGIVASIFVFILGIGITYYLKNELI